LSFLYKPHKNSLCPETTSCRCHVVGEEDKIVFHTGSRVDDAASRGALDKDLVDVLLWLVVQLDAAKIC
jgi:hypothetical protein